MSAVSPAVSADARTSGTAQRSRRPITASLVFSGPVIALLGWGAYRYRGDLARSWRELLIWAAAIAFLNLLDIPAWNGRHLSPAVSLGVASALMMPPLIAGLLTFVSSLDPREVRLQTRTHRALFNRSQCSLGVMSGSLAALPWSQLDGPFQLLAPALLALTISTGVNYVSVGMVWGLIEGLPLRDSVLRLRVGRPLDFVLTWLSWGISGYLLVVAYDSMGPWALCAFPALALVGRQLLSRSEAHRTESSERASERNRLDALRRRVDLERLSERARVAAHLHDEILPPLYQVSLLSHVVQQDLATGRLLELEVDVPPLSSASDLASGKLRSLIQDLRRTVPLPAVGVATSLQALVEKLQSTSSATVSLEIHPTLSVDQTVELTLYQLCREALTNAVQHSGATQITVRVMHDDEFVRFSIEDDGVGFDTVVGHHNHFGLLLMRERADSVGGLICIDSVLGQGTIVAGRLPLSGTGQSNIPL